MSPRSLLPPLVAFVVFIFSWYLVALLAVRSELILPLPEAVVTKLFQQPAYLLRHGLITALEAALGFALGSASAFLLAVSFLYSKSLRLAIYPYAIAIKAIPLVALAPLVVIWFGSGLASKVVLAAIISFFPVLVSTAQGFNDVDADYLDLFSTLCANNTEVLLKLRIPASLPAVFSGLKVSASFSVVGAVVAEFSSSNSGIGYVIKSSSYYLDTSLTFAAIAVAAIVGLLFFGAVSAVESRLLFWDRRG